VKVKGDDVRGLLVVGVLLDGFNEVGWVDVGEREGFIVGVNVAGDGVGSWGEAVFGEEDGPTVGVWVGEVVLEGELEGLSEIG